MQVCPNGARTSGVPLAAAEVADSVAAAVAAGATDVHLHPKDAEGADTFEPDAVGSALSAVRDQVDVPVGVTTGAWALPDPRARIGAVRSWTVLPDHASVNWHEDGAEEVAMALLERGVDVEAGLWSGTDGAERFAASALRSRVLRVLAEVVDRNPATMLATADGLLAAIGSAHGRPVLLHGEDASAWPVLRLARSRGLATRIGLEDTLKLPDGSPASSNADLVRAALSASR